MSRENESNNTYEDIVFSSDDGSLELKNNIVDEFQGFSDDDFEEKDEEIQRTSAMKDFAISTFPGVIITFLSLISKKISKLSRNGFFGSFFTLLYSKYDDQKSNGLLGRLFASLKNGKKNKVKLRTKIASLYENSLTAKTVESIRTSIIHCNVNIIGAFLIALGSVIELLFLLKHFVLLKTDSDSFVWLGIILIILSIPPLSSDKQIGDAIISGKISKYLFVKVFGFEEKLFESDREKRVGYPFAAVFFGILFGLFSYFINPVIYLEIILIIISGSLVLATPEVGIVIICALIPCSSLFGSPIFMLMLYTLFVVCAFFFKWIVGRRIIKIGLIDIFVLLFSSFVIFGGFSGLGGKESLKSAIIYAVFSSFYFLIVNLFKKIRRILRSVRILVLSTSFAAFSCLVVQMETLLNPDWINGAFFKIINEPLFMFYNDISIVSLIIVMILPFALGQIFSDNTKTAKILYVFCSIVMIACAYLSGSNMIMLGVIVSIIVFFILNDAKSIWAFIALIISLPIISLLIPNEVILKNLSTSVISHSSIEYTFSTWRGVGKIIKDFWLMGIGVGESAFCDMYPMYAYAGALQSTNAHNIWLGILVSIGIVGLLVFLILIILFFQKGFEHLRFCDDRPKIKTIISSGIASILAVLFSGFGNDIFTNYRVFFVFFIVLGLVSATIDIDRSRLLRESTSSLENEKNATIDIDLEL